MHIKQIKLVYFRNYTNNQYRFEPGIHCVVGENGMGKTNLLEAIYYLCVGKSPFTGIDRYVIQQDAEFMRLDGLFEKDEQEIQVVVKLIPGKEKTIEKEGKAYDRLADHVGSFPVVMISPEDQELIQGGSQERRSLIDFTISQTDTAYLNDLMDYRRAWRQKSKALKAGYEKDNINIDLIRVYNEQMAEPAARIYQKRKEFTADMRPIIQALYQGIAQRPENLNLNYRSELSGREAHTFYESYLEQECRQGRVLAGVHRDDWRFTILGRPARKYASQGQKKSLTLALKLCQYQFLYENTRYLPILLLDDIFDKLDRSRVRHLMELLLKGPYGQVFISDTHEQRVPDILRNMNQSCRIYKIKQGQQLSGDQEE